MAEKARYWCGIAYPENMVDDWQEVIGEVIQYPYCYCIHDKDTTKEGDLRKVHVHIMITFPNTTTSKNAINIINKLSSHYSIPCCPTIEMVNVGYMYNYLIHDTEDSRKKGKFQYSSFDRICGNGFDIGLYEQVSSAQKIELLRSLSDKIVDYGFCNISDFYNYLRGNNELDSLTFEVMKSNATFLNNLCKGNFHKRSGSKLL